MVEPLPYLACLGIASVAVYTDSKRGLIPNLITVPAALLGVALNGIAGGWEGLAFGLQGLAVGFGILLLPCLLGRTGGGDVKLLAAFGAFLGTAAVLKILFFAGLLGAALALFLLARKFGASWLATSLATGGARTVVALSSLRAVGPFPFAASLLAGVVLLPILRPW